MTASPDVLDFKNPLTVPCDHELVLQVNPNMIRMKMTEGLTRGFLFSMRCKNRPTPSHFLQAARQLLG